MSDAVGVQHGASARPTGAVASFVAVATTVAATVDNQPI